MNAHRINEGVFPDISNGKKPTSFSSKIQTRSIPQDKSLI